MMPKIILNGVLISEQHLIIFSMIWLDSTASIGRRPSTTGFLSNLREDDNAQSPLGHLIDVEFDGASSKVKLEKLTGVSGISFKLCLGQGST
jgi:hypothetical protein